MTTMILQLKDGLTSDEIESLRTVLEKFKKVKSITVSEAVEHTIALDGLCPFCGDPIATEHAHEFCYPAETPSSKAQPRFEELA